MVILGIDPGLALTGVGVVEKVGSKLYHLHHSCIRTAAKEKESLRLKIIYDELTQIIQTYSPSCLSIESLLFNKNVSSACAVSQARGVLLLCGALHQLDIHTYSPLQTKTAVTGYGRADKKQVQFMVQKLLNLSKIPRPDDAADGLALAICHSQYVSVQSKI